jgi:hypothetical protein
VENNCDLLIADSFLEMMAWQAMNNFTGEQEAIALLG